MEGNKRHRGGRVDQDGRVGEKERKDRHEIAIGQIRLIFPDQEREPGQKGHHNDNGEAQSDRRGENQRQKPE